MSKKQTEHLRNELALDILDEVDIYPHQADAIISFLLQEGLIDYSVLEEYYLDE